MKTTILLPCLGEARMRSRVLFVLIAALNFLSVGQAPGQAFTTFHSLSGGGGASPFAGLVISSNTLYQLNNKRRTPHASQSFGDSDNPCFAGHVA
jgi:hypothetical protein